MNQTFSKILIASTLIVLVAGGVYTVEKKLAQQNAIQKEFAKWGVYFPGEITPIDDRKVSPALPLVIDSRLSFFDLSTYSSKETDQIASSSGRDSGVLLVSNIAPNFKKFAFTDGSGNFKIVTTDLSKNLIVFDAEKHKLTLKPHVDSVTWSKDSSRLIFRISDNDSEYAPPERSKAEEDFLKILVGYYLIDFRSGVVRKTSIPFNAYTITPISSSHFLFQHYTHKIDQLGVFNAEMLRSEYLYNLTEYFGQYSVDQVGHKWTFSIAPRIGEEQSIIYGEFPSLEGDTIEKGSWAQVQWPVISPDGDQVLFVKAMDPGANIFSLWLYDSKSISKKVLAGADSSARYWPEVWIDNKRFIFSRMGPLQWIASRDFFIYNLHDDSVLPIR